MEFREVCTSRMKPYGRLALELNGAGTHSIERAALSMSLSPLHTIITSFLAYEQPAPPATELQEEEEAVELEKAIARLLETVALQFGELMEQPLTVPENLAKEAAERHRKAAALAITLPGQKECKKLQAALGFSSREHSDYFTIATQWIVLNAIQEMAASSGALNSNLIDDWLMQGALREIYPEKGVIGIPGGEMADLLVCMLSKKPECTPSEPEAYLCAILKTLYTENREHLGGLLQFDLRQEKTWFREHRFSVLVAWLTLQELLQEPESLTPKEREEEKTAIARWIAATEKLDLKAFLSGYEMGEFLREEG